MATSKLQSLVYVTDVVILSGFFSRVLIKGFVRQSVVHSVTLEPINVKNYF